MSTQCHRCKKALPTAISSPSYPICSNHFGSPPKTIKRGNLAAPKKARINNPRSSIREGERILEVSRPSIQRILKREKQHAHYFQKTQELLEEDFPRRVVLQGNTTHIQEDHDRMKILEVLVKDCLNNKLLLQKK